NQVPKQEDLEALMNQPGGERELDELAGRLDGAKINQQVFAAILEARFKCTFTQYKKKHKADEGVWAMVAGLKRQLNIEVTDKDLDPSNLAEKAAPDKSVKQLYLALLKVPAKHGKNNEKLAEIVHFKANEAGEGKGGEYDQGKVVLYCGR